MWVDRILILGAFAGLCVFVYVIIKFVAEPNLWIVIAIVLAVTGHFIWREIRRSGQGAQNAEDRQNGS